MTTKGIKWAMRYTEELALLKKDMERLAADTNDICPLMKIVLTNRYLKMSTGMKHSLMAKHIKIDDCDQCIYYTTEHPDYLGEHLEKKT